MSNSRLHLWKRTLILSNLSATNTELLHTIETLRQDNAHVQHTTHMTPDPIPKDEAMVQALRYLRGFIFIIQHTPEAIIQRHLLQQINNMLGSFGQRAAAEHHAKHTYWLADQFASILESSCNITNKDARTQLTMARDLGVMLETHQPVCTVSNSNGRVVVQRSTLYKLEPNAKIIYYRDQTWFKLAKMQAGWQPEKATWLDNFFAEHALQIAKIGNPAPPSARWLPLAANVHQTSISVGDPDLSTDASKTSAIRLGTVNAYDINSFSEQKQIARDILFELIRANLDNKISDYQQLYGYGQHEAFTFFINYQTLLSPLPGEEALPHKNNNARFIANTIEALHAISSLSGLTHLHPNAALAFYHTNTAINKKAGLASSQQADDAARLIKLFQTKRVLMDIIHKNMDKHLCVDLEKLNHLQLLNMIKENIPYLPLALLNELTLRVQACTHLQHLLLDEEPYCHLQTYQRNIMMAALEFLTLGSQALALVGCKSARDRTAIFLSAVKTMQENRTAMHDWQALFSGIIQTINQGHHFRTLHVHSAIVKVAQVHEDFMRALDRNTQHKITSLLPFSNKLKPFTEAYPSVQKNWFLSLFSPVRSPQHEHNESVSSRHR